MKYAKLLSIGCLLLGLTSAHANPDLPHGEVRYESKDQPAYSGGPTPSSAEIAAQEITNVFNKGPDRFLEAMGRIDDQVRELQAKRGKTTEEIRLLREQIEKLQGASVSGFAQEALKRLQNEEIKSVDLDSIPDPDECVLPYQFQTEDPEVRDKLLSLYKDLYKINPVGALKKDARSFGLSAVEEADQAYIAGQYDEASIYQGLAEEFLDIAVGLDPVTGLARSSYELFTGKNFVTGMKLSALERSFAFLGVATVGTSNSVLKSSQVVLKLAKRVKTLSKELPAIEIAVREGARIIENAPKVVEEFAHVARKTPGVAEVTGKLTNPIKMMRGSHGNAGLVPKEVGEKLAGKEFRSLDHFREQFWKTVADSKYTKEFSSKNIKLMKEGNAPFAVKTQRHGEVKRYELHHIQPICRGGKVYDLSNVMITTPKFHKEVLEKGYHYGK